MSEENLNTASSGNDGAISDTTTQNEETTNTQSETTSEQDKNTASTQTVEEKKEVQQEITSENVDPILKDKGFDYKDLQAEWYEKGVLSEETITKLEKAGFSKEQVNDFITARMSENQAAATDIINYIGGKEKYEAIHNWATANLSDEEKTVINSFHDPLAIKVLLDGLNARMEKAEGVIPNQLKGRATTDEADLFQSMAEVQEAILNPKYAKDEVYREKVSKKITASRKAGKINL